MKARAAAAAAGMLALAAFAPAVAVEAPVTLVVHVVLLVPQALRPTADAYCLGDVRPARDTPIASALLARYDAALAGLGPAIDRFGYGTWTVGSPAASQVAFEPVDHVFVRMRPSAIARALPQLLARMRRELHQQEALAEVFAARPALGQARTRLDVRLPFDRANFTRLRRAHAIFGDAGRSGASQYDAADGVHVYSSVPPADAQRIARALRAAGFAFTRAPSRFIAADAPACASSRRSSAAP